MYDYSLNEEKRGKYVLGYEKGESGNLIVYFSDTNNTEKVSFLDVLDNDENRHKLDHKMDEQMIEAIQNKKKFVLNKKESLRKTVCCIGAGVGAITVGVVGYLKDADAIPAAGFGIFGGVLTVVGIAKFYREYLKDKEKVNEIEKAEYIRDNKKKLDSISSYPNSLAGVRDGVSTFIRNFKDPFKVNNYDLFEMKDLDQIILNVEREEEFGFQYVKKQTNNDKGVPTIQI